MKRTSSTAKQNEWIIKMKIRVFLLRFRQTNIMFHKEIFQGTTFMFFFSSRRWIYRCRSFIYICVFGDKFSGKKILWQYLFMRVLSITFSWFNCNCLNMVCSCFIQYNVQRNFLQIHLQWCSTALSKLYHHRAKGMWLFRINDEKDHIFSRAIFINTHFISIK